MYAALYVVMDSGTIGYVCSMRYVMYVALYAVMYLAEHCVNMYAYRPGASSIYHC